MSAPCPGNCFGLELHGDPIACITAARSDHLIAAHCDDGVMSFKSRWNLDAKRFNIEQAPSFGTAQCLLPLGNASRDLGLRPCTSPPESFFAETLGNDLFSLRDGRGDLCVSDRRAAEVEGPAVGLAACENATVARLLARCMPCPGKPLSATMWILIGFLLLIFAALPQLLSLLVVCCHRSAP